MSAASSVVGPALPVSKRDRIVYLLDHWDDIFSPPVSIGLFSAGGSSGSPHLSGMARHSSVVELVRCLAVLKLEEPRWHDHVKLFHCAEWKIRTWSTVVRRKGGKRETVVHRDRARRPPADVRMDWVRLGEDRLAELFVGDVSIPTELWEALTLSSEEIAVRESRRRRDSVAA
jgi:hypothetical protein